MKNLWPLLANIWFIVVIAIAIVTIGVFIMQNFIEPINKACEKTNGTIIMNGKKINCYDWKYNLTLEHPWPW